MSYQKKLHLVTTASCGMGILVMGSTNCCNDTGYENLNTPSRQGLLSPLHEPIKAASISTLLLFSTHGTYIAGWCSTPNQLHIFPKCLSFADLLITKHSPDISIYIYKHNNYIYAGIDKYIIYFKYICLNINAVCLYEEPNVQGGYLFFLVPWIQTTNNQTTTHLGSTIPPPSHSQHPDDLKPYNSWTIKPWNLQPWNPKTLRPSNPQTLKLSNLQQPSKNSNPGKKSKTGILEPLNS